VRLKINNDWRLHTAPNNVILEHRSAGGKWTNSYHGSFEAALGYLVEQEVKEVSNVRKVAKAVRDMKIWLSEAIAQLEVNQT